MRVVTLLCCLLITGCGVKLYTYNEAGIANEKLASIVHEDIGAFISGRELNVSIRRILDEEFNLIKEGKTGIAEEIRLQPGIYRFEIKCSDGNDVSSHRYVKQTLKFQVKAGVNYIAYCVGKFEERGLFKELFFVSGLAAISEISNYEMDKKRLLSKTE